jgi:hypothetical protein
MNKVIEQRMIGIPRTSERRSMIDWKRLDTEISFLNGKPEYSNPNE